MINCEKDCQLGYAKMSEQTCVNMSKATGAIKHTQDCMYCQHRQLLEAEAEIESEKDYTRRCEHFAKKMSTKVDELTKQTGHWTKEPPTVDGWYYVKREGEDSPAQIFACSSHGKLFTCRCMTDTSHTDMNIEEWWSEKVTFPPFPVGEKEE